MAQLLYRRRHARLHHGHRARAPSQQSDNRRGSGRSPSTTVQQSPSARLKKPFRLAFSGFSLCSSRSTQTDLFSGCIPRYTYIVDFSRIICSWDSDSFSASHTFIICPTDDSATRLQLDVPKRSHPWTIHASRVPVSRRTNLRRLTQCTSNTRS